MKRNINVIIFLFALIIFSCCPAQTTYIQPQEIVQGDISVLVIESENKLPILDTLDTSALEENFEIIKVSSSVIRKKKNQNIIHITRWEIELFPLKVGKLDIPTLKFNNGQTLALELEVKQNPSLENNRNLFITMTSKPEQPYLGQQTNIIVKLYHNIEIITALLPIPKVGNQDIKKIGGSVVYQEFVGNKLYDVLERRFAMFPQVLGELQVSAVSFKGRVGGNFHELNQRFGSSLRQQKIIKRTSDNLHLKIKDIPPRYKGEYWLPAKNLQVVEQWNHSATNFKIGDSLTRTITIIADGIRAEALPDNIFETNKVPECNIYSEIPIIVNEIVDDSLIGSLSRTYALVFNKAGIINIPKLTVNWWDVDEEIEKQIVLEERKLTVTNHVSLKDNQAPLNDRQKLVDVLDYDFNFWKWLTLIIFLAWIPLLLMIIKQKWF